MLHASPKPKERRREANLLKILDAAMGLITEGGFAALSMSRLADRCDYTPGALYRYFASKDMLLSALVSRTLDEVQQTLSEGIARLPEERPLARVFALCASYRRFSEEQPHKFALIATSFTDPEKLLTSPQSAAPVVRATIETLSSLGDALAAAEKTGMLRPGSVIDRSLLVFTSTQGVLQMHKQARVAPHLIDVERLSAAVVRALLMGWGADGAAVDAAHDEALAAERAGGLS